MIEIASIAFGFILTTVVGGWWASRLQERSWDRQNRLRLEEEDRKRAAEVCRDLSGLLDKRLYRMRRLYWAIEGLAAGTVEESVLQGRRKDYDDVLYEWNDTLNTNLAVIGSHFGEAARAYLDLLYDDFRRVGRELERGLQAALRGDQLHGFQDLDSEFEGSDQRTLNNSVYLLVLAMTSQLREGVVGRAAPDKTAVPVLTLPA